jgi:hypothetical protein
MIDRIEASLGAVDGEIKWEKMDATKQPIQWSFEQSM